MPEELWAKDKFAEGRRYKGTQESGGTIFFSLSLLGPPIDERIKVAESLSPMRSQRPHKRSQSPSAPPATVISLLFVHPILSVRGGGEERIAQSLMSVWCASTWT